MAYELGVDLGTTYTAAAAHRGGSARIVELGNRSATIPSVIFLTEDGTVLTGEAANRRAATDPSRVAREFKRRIGDTTPLLLGGSPYSAESLSARLLEWVITKVTETEGEASNRVAVTHPANWGPYKLDLLHQAVRLANIEQVVTLTEPEAAALYYSTLERIEPGMTVGVFDLGGGTFDAAVLRKKASGFDFLGQPEGIERLGGIDFDAAVFAFARNAVGSAIDGLDMNDPTALAAVARLRRDCVDAKEALSSDTEVTIPVVLPGLHTDIRLTRSEFEQMVRPSLGDAIGAMQRAVRSAGLNMDDLNLVLLVGGSSRVPLVSLMVGGELGVRVAVDAHPKHSVAIGAALAAANAGAAHLASVTGAIPVQSQRQPAPQPAQPAVQPGATEQARPRIEAQPPPAAARPDFSETVAAPVGFHPDRGTPSSMGIPAVKAQPVPGGQPSAVYPPADTSRTEVLRPEQGGRSPFQRLDQGGPPPGRPDSYPSQDPSQGAPFQRQAPRPGPGPDRGRSFTPLLVGGALVAILVLAFVLYSQLTGTEGENIAAENTGDVATDVGADQVAADDASTPDPTDGTGTETPEASDASDALTESSLVEDDSAATDLPQEEPTATAAPEAVCAGLCTRFESVTPEDDGELIIYWEAVNFTPNTVDTHAHFFFDIYDAEQAGTNADTYGATQGDWELTDQQPFSTRGTNVAISSAPAGATAICVVAADSGHGVINPENAECWDL